MRILFDHGTPVPLRRALSRHTVTTAYQRGWAELDNGRLHRAAEREFDVFITTDKNLRFQQNLTDFRIAVLVLPGANWPILEPFAADIAAAAEAVRMGELAEFRLPEPK